MPLCSPCRAEAEYTVNGTRAGGTRPQTELPPYGMQWGESCDRCGNTAEVSF